MHELQDRPGGQSEQGLECEVWSNPTGIILSFADPARGPHNGIMRVLRLDPALGWPDLGRSQGVAGVRDLPQGRYVALSRDHALLALRPERDPRPALELANIPLRDWRYVSDRQVTFSFAGQFNLEFSVRSASPCRVAASSFLRTASSVLPGMIES